MAGDGATPWEADAMKDFLAGIGFGLLFLVSAVIGAGVVVWVIEGTFPWP